MSILDRLISRMEKKVAKIGIGLGDSEFHNNKILYASIKFLNLFKENDYLKVYLFGTKEHIDILSVNSSYKKYKEKIILIDSEDPEETLFRYLNEFELTSIIRGSIKSTKFLESIKKIYDVNINRLALLETNSGDQFFFAPVGIDECNSLTTKIDFIHLAIEEIRTLGIIPNVCVLSGGRKDDIGRDERVDATIKEAEGVIKHFRDMDPELRIYTSEILIEKAIEKAANLIIAPDGISGNLIYRTLVHLGGGKAYGAIYLGLHKIIIDTSRVGNLNEIYGAFILALTLQT